ncbi:hypothetical protein C8J57DRAFT_1210596 [Mycena rebaudengoi]|nr:hypothetical protein C8J57DRAFT_1210596 [Mycena rebaudengoi]
MALWNVTIDDTSPFFTYKPYADGSNSGLANGWIPWYSGSNFITQNGQGGDGDSYHLTSLNGAQVNLVFYGTGVFLYGKTNGSYGITVDDQDFPSDSRTSSGLLFAGTGLKEGTHSGMAALTGGYIATKQIPAVTLTVKATDSSQQMSFDQCGYLNSIGDQAFVDNTDMTRLEYTGNWASSTAPGIPNSSVTHSWQETFDAGARVTMNIEPGAVGVSIWGMANWGNWLYTVSLDGGSESTYNGSTFWKVPDALLFFQSGLDPTKSHTVTLKNLTPKMKLALNSIRTYNIPSRLQSGSTSVSASSSSTGASAPGHSSVSVGIIVGPILGVAALAFVAVFFFCWFRSRRSINTPQRYPNAPAEPYTDHSPHRPQFSSNYPVSSTTELTAVPPSSGYSTPSTQFGGPPGATVMTWGEPYHVQLQAAVNAHVSGPPSTHSHNTNHYGPSTNMSSSAYPPSSDGTPTEFSESRYRPQPPASQKSTFSSPPPATAAPSAGSSAVDGPDVDRLIELIAQRIDRGRHDDDSAPPEYRG